MKKSEVFKSYNLKLSEKAYFKLRKIELSLEQKKGKSLTKNEVLTELILMHKA